MQSLHVAAPRLPGQGGQASQRGGRRGAAALEGRALPDQPARGRGPHVRTPHARAPRPQPAGGAGVVAEDAKPRLAPCGHAVGIATALQGLQEHIAPHAQNSSEARRKRRGAAACSAEEVAAASRMVAEEAMARVMNDVEVQLVREAAEMQAIFARERKERKKERKRSRAALPEDVGGVMPGGLSYVRPDFVDGVRHCSSAADFAPLCMLGRGAFGQVTLCRWRGDGRPYAMKVIRVETAVREKLVGTLLAERRVLAEMAEAPHPLLTSARCCFRSANHLHFVMPFLQGGSLERLLTERSFLPEDTVRFFVAQLVLALGALHARRILYLDLKLENVMISASGDATLVDFGFVRCDVDVAAGKTVKRPGGTRCYLPPEAILGQPVGGTCDWWALGVVCFELLTGWSPFTGDKKALGAAICNARVRFPRAITPPGGGEEVEMSFSGDAVGVVRRLLEKKSEARLGVNGMAEVKLHPFFRPIDWDALANGSLPRPHVPQLANEIDVCCFDRKYTSQPGRLSVADGPAESTPASTPSPVSAPPSASAPAASSPPASAPPCPPLTLPPNLPAPSSSSSAAPLRPSPPAPRPEVRHCRYCSIAVVDDQFVESHLKGKKHLKLAAAAGATSADCWVWRPLDQPAADPSSPPPATAPSPRVPTAWDTAAPMWSAVPPPASQPVAPAAARMPPSPPALKSWAAIATPIKAATPPAPHSQPRAATADWGARGAEGAPPSASAQPVLSVGARTGGRLPATPDGGSGAPLAPLGEATEEAETSAAREEVREKVAALHVSAPSDEELRKLSREAFAYVAPEWR